MADVRDNSRQVEVKGVGSATLSTVAASATSVQLVAANANRRGLMLVNDSTAIAYVKFGATASTSSFTVKMQPSDYFEAPQPVYTGTIDAIWGSANGNMRVTEL